MDLKELTNETKKVVANFPYPDWSYETWTMDLVEEVGELCQATLIDRKLKSAKRTRTTIENAVCDILFDLLMIADVRKIDLEEEYLKVLEEIKVKQQDKVW